MDIRPTKKPDIQRIGRQIRQFRRLSSVLGDKSRKSAKYAHEALGGTAEIKRDDVARAHGIWSSLDSSATPSARLLCFAVVRVSLDATPDWRRRWASRITASDQVTSASILD